MLEIEAVAAGYGSGPVLDDMNLHLGEGSRTAVLGRNGVGKTTLMRVIAGVVRPTRGVIRFEGRDITSLPAHRRARGGIAYVPQGRDIFPAMSVIDNLRVAAHATRQPDAGRLLSGVLEEFPVLAEKADLPGGGLSGGQQQILALGRALMTRPRLLILDEPSEGIQPSIVHQIAAHVRRLNEEQGITVLVVEQNLEFAASLAVDAHLVDHGTVVRSLPTAEVVRDRELQHEYLGV